MTDLTLRNGQVVTPTGIVRGGLSASGGVITHVGPDPILPEAGLDLDVAGQYVFPGLIDPHTHMGVGGEDGIRKFEEDFESESKDAAAGGVTTLVTTTLMGPEPGVDMESRVQITELNLEQAERASTIDFRLTGTITQLKHVDEIEDMVDLGVRSFKFFLGYNGPQAASFGIPPEGITWDLFYRAGKAIHDASPAAFATIHAEDPHVRGYLHEQLRDRRRRGPLQDWWQTSPNFLEPMQIYPAALIADEVGIALYPVHTSAWESVELIRWLKEHDYEVHCETIAAFLYWTAAEADEKEKGTFAKVQPPIRGDRDREKLWEGIRDGTVTHVGTDHLGYPRAARLGDFWDTRVGLGPGMGTLLPAMYTSGVQAGRCTIEDLARVLCENNARRFDLYPQKGVLQVGSDADVVVLDPGEERVVDAEDLKSGCGYSLYEGESLRGWPSMVFLRGNLLVRGNQLVADDAVGRHVPPSSAWVPGVPHAV